MPINIHLAWFLSFVFVVSPLFSSVQAQSGNVLPRPEPAFQGAICETENESTPYFPKPYKAPKGSPNVLIIMTDDVGFSATRTFGGPIETPTFDSLAKAGIRYNCFHTTALCSPTRASLLTGRNHHSASTGNIMEFATGYPGYNSLMSKSCGTAGEILKQHGYSTAWFGKNHNVPDWQTSQVGPFDLWPTGLGFDYFYGFLGGDTNQWHPLFYEGTTPLEKTTAEKDLHFDQMLADKAIHWIKTQHALDPEKPFFVYYTPGTAHAPHHAPKEYIAQMKGKFDQGWDKVREETFAKQLKEGIIPPGTQLTSRPKEIPAWDSLNVRQKEVYARMMEVYAGALRHFDDQLGRVIDTIKEIGEFDNTLIIFIQGDNGPSGEGGLQGKVDEMSSDMVPEDFDFVYSMMDELGGPKTFNHYPVGWAHAMTTPMQWTKQVASHFGGTRNGLVVCWSKGIKARGEIRTQFHHVIDIMPTILDVVGITAPDMLNGVVQKSIDGISMRYTFDDLAVPTKRTTQYFEMVGNRAIYRDGWMASTTPQRLPWDYFKGDPDPNSFPWELYHLTEDFAQAKNLAEKYPEKLKELQVLFKSEAEKYNVFPLDASFVARADVSLRPSLTEGRTTFEFFQGMDRIPESAAPDMKNRSFKIKADLVVPEGVSDGMIVTQGGRGTGWALYVWNGKPTFVYSISAQPKEGYQSRIVANESLLPGKYTLCFEFEYAVPGTYGGGGTGKLFLDDRKIGEGKIAQTAMARISLSETFDVGLDRGTPVIDDYLEKMPFAYPGKIEKLTIELGERKAPAKVDPRMVDR